MFGPVSTAEGRVVITEVFVDVPLPDQLTINGQDFDNGPGLAVTLGEFAAPLDAAAPNQIVVDLPFGLVAGDYLLAAVRFGAALDSQMNSRRRQPSGRMRAWPLARSIVARQASRRGAGADELMRMQPS